jgi:hypothetical protein
MGQKSFNRKRDCDIEKCILLQNTRILLCSSYVVETQISSRGWP